MPQVFVQKWQEKERGWGERPDGYSLHATEADVAEYVQAYWAKMPKTAPSEYSHPCGTIYAAEVTSEVFAEVQASKNGVRHFNNNYPGSGGPDGWRPMKTSAVAK